MTGIIFTEFLDMVRTRYGAPALEQLRLESPPEISLDYIADRSYSHREIVSLLELFAQQHSIELPRLLEEFGTYLFRSFSRIYPELFEEVYNCFDFLEGIERQIHSSVRKRHPAARPPVISCQREGPNTLALLYRSDRNMIDLAIGLIKGALSYFEENCTVVCIPEDNGIRIVIRRI